MIDGVVLARPGQSTLDLIDIDRIEILRGPQGTLFGKNASAGVVNIVSRNPTDTISGYGDAAVYSGGEYRFKGTLSGPIIADKLDGSISLLGAHYDGNVHDVLRHGDKVNGYTHEGVRLKFVANLTEKWRFTLTADNVAGKDSTPIGVFISTQRVAYPTNIVTPNPALASLLASYGVTPSSDNKNGVSGLGTTVKDRNAGIGTQSDYTLGGFTLTSISGYRTWKNHQAQDFDALPIPTATFPEARDDGIVDFIQWSQEYRITSPTGGFFDYVAGLYFMKAQTKEIYQRALTRIVGPATLNDSGIAHYGTVGKNYAIYGEGNFNVTKDFRVIVGPAASATTSATTTTAWRRPWWR